MQLSKFNIAGRVTRDDSDKVGVVTGIGREVHYPGYGPTRKIWACFPDSPERWFWEFELEVW
jgi:hypothetical protein